MEHKLRQSQGSVEPAWQYFSPESRAVSVPMFNKEQSYGFNTNHMNIDLNSMSKTLTLNMNNPPEGIYPHVPYMKYPAQYNIANFVW